MADPGSKAQVKAESISDMTQGSMLGTPTANLPAADPQLPGRTAAARDRKKGQTTPTPWGDFTSRNPGVSADQNLVKNSTDTINRSDPTNTQRTLELTEKRNCLPWPAGCRLVRLHILTKTTVLRDQGPAHCRRAHLNLTNSVHNSPVSPEGHIHRC